MDDQLAHDGKGTQATRLSIKTYMFVLSHHP